MDVYGFGEQKTPESFRQACSRFVYTEKLVGALAPNASTAPSAQPLQPPSAATPLLKKVIDQMESEDGWVNLASLGQRLTNFRADFDPRTYGSTKLSDLVRKTGVFELGQTEGKSTRVRLKADTQEKPARAAKRGKRAKPVAD